MVVFECAGDDGAIGGAILDVGDLGEAAPAGAPVTAIQRFAAAPKPNGYANEVRVRLYRWPTVGTTFGVVYASAIARDSLVRRLAMATGEAPVAVPSGDFPIASVRTPRLREGWERNARADGAVLATGLGAR